MKRMVFWLTLILALSLSVPCLAYDIPPAPVGSERYVADLAGILSPEEKQQLAEQAAGIEAKTTAEVVFLTVVMNDPGDLNGFATELGHQWGVGKEDVDNGVIIAVAANRKDAFYKPRTDDRRRAEVVTGYGAEGAIPDTVAKAIVDETMKPRLGSGQYALAFVAAGVRVQELMAADPETVSSGKKPSSGPGISLPWLYLAIVGVLLIGLGIYITRKNERYEASASPSPQIPRRPNVPTHRRRPSYIPPLPPDYIPPRSRPRSETKTSSTAPTVQTRRRQDEDDDDSYSQRSRRESSSSWGSGFDSGSSSGSSDSGTFGGGGFGAGGGGSDF